MFSGWTGLLQRLEQLPVPVAVSLVVLVAMVVIACVIIPVVLFLASASSDVRRWAAIKRGQRGQPSAPSPVRQLRRILRYLEAVNLLVGHCIAWLALFMVLVQFIVVIMRYVFSLGSIQMQESIWYMHGVLFMLGAGYTLLKNGHVRIDIFYREANDRRRALIDLVGTLIFLFPFLVFIWWSAWSYVLNAWAVRESSTEISGLPYIYLLKTIVLIFVGLMMMQGVANVIRSALVLVWNSKTDDDSAGATESWTS